MLNQANSSAIGTRPPKSTSTAQAHTQPRRQEVQRRRLQRNESANNMMEVARDSFTVPPPGSHQNAEGGSCLGDLSPLDDADQCEGLLHQAKNADSADTSPTPVKKHEFSEGLDSATAPHMQMAHKAKYNIVSSFIVSSGEVAEAATAHQKK